MKKRSITFLFASLFSLLLAVSCSGKQGSECDPMFEDCDTSSNSITNVELESDESSNYIYDNVSNANGSVGYEIFVRSFYDSNGDGIGDLNGVSAKIPYLEQLGVSNIWLMPIHPSPSYHGYDVSDYYDIHPDYGTLNDFKALVQTANEANIDITIDMVLNHTSRNHPWFSQSYEAYRIGDLSEDSMANWYNWSTTSKSGYSSYGGFYYEARFDSSMPDLNTENPYVRDEIDKILKFWIDLGVKGFRLDAVKYYDYENVSYNAEFLTFLKNTASNYDEEVFFVGECWDNINVINDYYQSACDSFFKFNASLEGYGNDAFVGQVKCVNNASTFASMIESQEAILKTNNPKGYSSYFLSNHDMDRSSNSFEGDNAKMAASLYLLMPGTPYMYYGEEIALKGKRKTSPDDNSDARRRLPMIWSSTNKVGECDFPETNRQDLIDNEQVSEGVDDQLATNYSLLNHYRKVINVRNKYSFIKDAVFTSLVSNLNTDNTHVLAYSLSLGDEQIVIVHNFNEYNVEVTLPIASASILDSISISHKIPLIQNGMLKIGAQSTVVLG